LFLDEPTAALDATARHDLGGLLGAVREGGDGREAVRRW